MEVQALGYVGIGASDLTDWTDFATNWLGMQMVERGNACRAFRMDDRRQRLVVDRVRDEERDELLGVLVRAVRVRAASDDRVDTMGDDIAADEELAGGLGGRVRGARSEGVVLARLAARHRPVDLVRRDLDVARGGRALAGGGAVAFAADRLEEDVDADDPGHEERLRVEDRPVDV